MNKLHRLLAAAIAIACVSASIPALVAGPAAALNLPEPTVAEFNKPCADAEIVFARGSGQTLDDHDWSSFERELKSRIKAPLTHHFYQVGTEKIDGWLYPAQSISDSMQYLIMGLAKISSGSAFHYGMSVNQGKEETNAYLTKRMGKCPDSSYILAGFSQGAQVIGETYVEELDEEQRGRIIYMALFGDPKTYLPEGYDPASQREGSYLLEEGVVPDACMGKNLSPYRAFVADCYTHEGSLNPRKPYVPKDWTENTGIWCQSKDFVCGSADATMNDADGHNEYPQQGRHAEAATAIMLRLAAALPPEKAVHLQLKEGSKVKNTVFVIDSTGSMGWQIDEAKQFAAEQMDSLTSNGGKVALVEYRDAGDLFTARVLSPLSTDSAALKEKLGAITPGGGGDTPEGLLHALMTAFNSLEWENGATKAAVVLTDAGFHSPDLTPESETGDHATLEAVVKRSLEIDPVNVYPVVPWHISEQYAELAAKTSGKVVVNDGDAAIALREAMTSLDERPLVYLPLAKYEAPAGGTITFDASRSRALHGTIASYEWDTDGDGIFEATTTTPVFEQTYPTALDGVMQVRVTDTNGEVGSSSALVHVGVPTRVYTAQPSGLAAREISTAGDKSEVEVTWTSADPRITSWGVTVNGTPIGRLEGAARSVTITDVEREEDVEFGVFGLNDRGQKGRAAETVLAAATVDQPEIVVTPSPVTPTPTPIPSNPPTAPVKPPAAAPVAPVAPVLPKVVQDVAPVNQAPTRVRPQNITVPIGEVTSQGETPGETVVDPVPPTPSPTVVPGIDAPSPQPSEPAPPSAAPPAEPVGGPVPFWPWVLGGIVILCVATVSLVHRRRNSA